MHILHVWYYSILCKILHRPQLDINPNKPRTNLSSTFLWLGPCGFCFGPTHVAPLLSQAFFHLHLDPNRLEWKESKHELINIYDVMLWCGSNVLIRNWQDSQFSMLPTYKELIAAGLRIWVFRYRVCLIDHPKFLIFCHKLDCFSLFYSKNFQCPGSVTNPSFRVVAGY